jgi:hypothetical protein
MGKLQKMERNGFAAAKEPFADGIDRFIPMRSSRRVAVILT